MNENENKNIGEGEQKPHRDEDTKAFNWQWTDGEDKAEQGQPEGGESKEVKPEETTPEESQFEKTRSAEAQKEEQPREESPKGETKPKKSRAPAVASILSACSIILLLSFALSLMLGIFPVKGRDVVLVGVSDGGKTDPDGRNEALQTLQQFPAVSAVARRAFFKLGRQVCQWHGQFQSGGIFGFADLFL